MAELYDKAGFQILLALSTRLLGYGCAVLARWLVYPSTLIYPKVLAAIALNEPPHNDNKLSTVHGWMMTRYRFVNGDVRCVHHFLPIYWKNIWNSAYF